MSYELWKDAFPERGSTFQSKSVSISRPQTDCPLSGCIGKGWSLDGKTTSLCSCATQSKLHEFRMIEQDMARGPPDSLKGVIVLRMAVFYSLWWEVQSEQ